MKIKCLYFIFLILIVTNAFAKSSQTSFKVSPIVGFEHVQQALPTPTMKTRAIVGAQAIYSLDFISFEAEYTHGQNTNSDSATDTSYKYVDDKLKMGVRGTFQMADFLSYHLNGGAQLTQSEVTKTVASTSTTSTNTTKVNPYIGTGVSLHFLDAFSLSASVTVVYKPTSTGGLSDFEYQPSLGFGVNF